MKETIVKISFVAASPEHFSEVQAFLQPFIDGQFLLPRTDDELNRLLNYAFVAIREETIGEETIVGFAALEIYSQKLAEIQCLAVSQAVQRRGVGRSLVNRCVAVAKQEKIRELMAISASDAMFQACGFDYSLPNQKRALFISPMESDASDED